MEASPLTASPPDWLESVLRKAAVIVLAGPLVFAPVFHGGWIIDGNFEVTENSVIQDASGPPTIWEGLSGADYLPIKSTLQWALWRWFGNNAQPFHLTSIALHLLCALLVWRLPWRLGLRHA